MTPARKKCQRQIRRNEQKDPASIDAYEKEREKDRGRERERVN